MTRGRISLIVGAALALGLALLVVQMTGRDRPPPVIDLIALFPDAEKRTTLDSLTEAFAVVDVSLEGHRRRAIFAHPTSRITWAVDVPPNAVLRTDAGMRMESWVGEGDGATFRVGVGDGTTYREYFERILDPYHRPEDRGWIPIEVDLAPYAGRRVTIVFNTGPGPWDNAVRDAAVWGAPRIEQRPAAETP